MAAIAPNIPTIFTTRRKERGKVIIQSITVHKERVLRILSSRLVITSKEGVGNQ